MKAVSENSNAAMRKSLVSSRMTSSTNSSRNKSSQLFLLGKALRLIILTPGSTAKLTIGKEKTLRKKTK